MDKCAGMVMDRLAFVVKEVLRVKTPKKVCAWCRRVMRDGEEPITHGICPECATREMRIFLMGKEVQGKRGPESSTMNGQKHNDGLFKKERS